MATRVAEKINHERASSAVLKTILQEVRVLRQNLLFFLPPEGLEDYAHPERIKRSYQKAIKKYPPAFAWK